MYSRGQEASGWRPSDSPSSPVPFVLRTLAARPCPSSASATPPRARPLACAAPCRQESAEHPASRRRALADSPQQPLPPARPDLVGAWGIVARFCVHGRSIQARTSPSLQPRRSSVRCLRELRELVLLFCLMISAITCACTLIRDLSISYQRETRLPGNQRTRLRCPGATQHAAARTPSW